MTGREGTFPDCKCCGNSSAWIGAVDSSVSDRDRRGDPLPRTGIEVDYYRCAACGFMFTPYFDDWSMARLKDEIYNDDYVTVDPDFAEIRPSAVADLVEDTFGGSRNDLAILDYGGGEGQTVAKLRSRGFRGAVNFDPFHDAESDPQGPFDLVIAFEVLEHVPDPHSVFANVVPRLKAGGLFMFSTLLQPEDIEEVGVTWWYVMPRNGHVSFHTGESLRLVAGRFGMNFGSLSGNVHLAYTEIPAFAAHLFWA